MDMNKAESVRLQRDCTEIEWSALIELFKLAGLAGREGDKVRRSFERSDVVCFALDGSNDVAIHPDYQRQAIGTRIIQEILSVLGVWRVLLVADADVRPFYEQLGFYRFEDVLARMDKSRLYDP